MSCELCQEWDWRNGSEQIKDFAARTFLEERSALGLVILPALQLQRSHPRPKPAAALSMDRANTMLGLAGIKIMGLEDVLRVSDCRQAGQDRATLPPSLAPRPSRARSMPNHAGQPRNAAGNPAALATADGQVELHVQVDVASKWLAS